MVFARAGNVAELSVSWAWSAPLAQLLVVSIAPTTFCPIGFALHFFFHVYGDKVVFLNEKKMDKLDNTILW